MKKGIQRTDACAQQHSYSHHQHESTKKRLSSALPLFICTFMHSTTTPEAHPKKNSVQSAKGGPSSIQKSKPALGEFKV